jgi:hypothetical protein
MTHLAPNIQPKAADAEITLNIVPKNNEQSKILNYQKVKKNECELYLL